MKVLHVNTYVHHPGVEELEKSQTEEAEEKDPDATHKHRHETMTSSLLHGCQDSLVARVVLEKKAITFVRRSFRDFYFFLWTKFAVVTYKLQCHVCVCVFTKMD